MAYELKVHDATREPNRSVSWTDSIRATWAWQDGTWRYRQGEDSIWTDTGLGWEDVTSNGKTLGGRYNLDLPWTATVYADTTSPWQSGAQDDEIRPPMAGIPHPGEQGFVVKDSGVREEYANGFVRDTEDGKPDLTESLRLLYARPDLAALISRPGFDLLPVEGLERWSDHMFKGAQKYGRDNWRQARGLVAKTRFLRSLVRHVAQYITGDRSEDHAAAVCFNVWAAEVTPADELET